MALVSLEDPGLTVFPTHRLISGLADDPAKQEALATGLREIFEVEEVPTDQLDPGGIEGVGVFGYIDSHFKRAFRLRLRDTTRLDRGPRGPLRLLPDAWTRRSSRSSSSRGSSA